MPLPSVPRVVEQEATKQNLGALLWVQPAAVQGDKVSAQGDYFYQHGLVVAHGLLRIHVDTMLWRDVAGLNWDLYVKAWNTTGTPVFQRVRVWHIEFNDGHLHTVELPERPVAGAPFMSGDQVQAEKRCGARSCATLAATWRSNWKTHKRLSAPGPTSCCTTTA